MRRVLLTLGLLSCLGACGTGEREPLAAIVQPVLWSDGQTLTAPGAMADDYFGYEVALGPSTAVVGSPFDGGADQGAAFVYERVGQAWQFQQKLTGTNVGYYDQLGNTVALSGDTAIAVSYAGTAYVFTRSGSTWTEQTKLNGSTADGYSEFGAPVALEGDTALFGAQGHAGKGAVFAFVRSGNVWTEQDILTAKDGASGDRFGSTVAISGDTALVGARANAGKGAAYVFVRSAGKWTEQKKLVGSDVAAGDGFGVSGGLSGDTALVCALHATGTAGKGYVFVGSADTWTEKPPLLPSNGALAKNFCANSALRGDTAVVGAWLTEGGKGAAHVFKRSGDTWTEQKILTTTEPNRLSVGWAAATTESDVLLGGQDGAYMFHLGAAPGEACAVELDCATGVCSEEGVCCDALCPGPCQSCVASRKGSGEDGVCGLVPPDTDPREACAEEPISGCGQTGLCDGAGACSLYEAGAVCSEAACPTAISQDLQDTCDGAGNCQVVEKSACEPGYLCLAGACKTECESDADCDGEHAFVCGSGICKVPSAEPCSVDSDCDSGHCADGLCCDQACDGQCETCAEPKHEGICTAVKGEPQGEREACEAGGDAACAQRCDGIKRASCQFVPATSDCGCAGPAAANQCDGQGSCGTQTSHSCGGFLCRDQACLSECTDETDCSPGYSCVSSQCLPAKGAECSDDLSATVVDGVAEPCQLYKCDPALGLCRERCSNTADCLGSAVCQAETGLCEEVAGASSDASGCGCRAVGGADGRGNTAPWLALTLLLGAARRSRRRH